MEELDQPHPLSAAVAVATLKRYLPYDEHRIRLHDLVMQEVKSLRMRITETVPSVHATIGREGEVYVCAVKQLDKLSETVMSLMVTGLYWGTSNQMNLWYRALERLGSTSVSDIGGGYMQWYDLLKYPALLALYAGGMGVLAADNEDALVRFPI